MTNNWTGIDTRLYDKPAFVEHLRGLAWAQWHPVGVTLHNTGAPNLRQWVELGASHDQRIQNLQHFYRDTKSWHAAVHGFISRGHFSGFSPMTAPGVHASCFNKDHLGFEMTGDFRKGGDQWSIGDGALVRDMAVFVLAATFKKLKLDPRAGLNFHRDCHADHHACPGDEVDFLDMKARVLAVIPQVDL